MGDKIAAETKDLIEKTFPLVIKSTDFSLDEKSRNLARVVLVRKLIRGGNKEITDAFN